MALSERVRRCSLSDDDGLDSNPDRHCDRFGGALVQAPSGQQGAICALCNKAFEPGQRILWRVKENTKEEFGWTATHLLCPRTVGLLFYVWVVLFLVAAGVLAVLVLVSS